MPCVRLADCELAFDRQGSGAPAVLFIHGYSCSAEDWRLQVADLAEDQTCVAMDLRGHGRSSPATLEVTMGTFAGDALALLDALEIETAVLVGHSMGTRIALEAALQAPDRVAGLVLVDGSKIEASANAVRVAISSAIDAEGFQGWSARNMGEMFLDGLSSRDRELILKRATNLGAKFGLNLYCSMTAWDQARLSLAAETVMVPISIIQSTSILPGEARLRCFVDEAPNSPWLNLWRAQGGAQIVTLPHTGHFAMLERPDMVNPVIRDLIKQI